mmetsp:Transcript_2152/g.4822  ORF Transcript_2152/g.4822 Transcript_2152/m.4822 type:complete len:145 (-) Transcript_2152:222-656(-)
MTDANELLYKVEYESYLHNRIESEEHVRSVWHSEVLEARYHEHLARLLDTRGAPPGEVHESLSRLLLPASPLVPASHATRHWRGRCAMDTSSSTCKPQPHPTTPLMDISISRQVDCRKRSLGSMQQLECSSPKRTRALQQGEWM